MSATQILRCNGVDIAYESLGDESAPAILLIMGLGMQMVAWPDDFCQALADRGFRVIRFDNRDTGLSTHVALTKQPNLILAMLAARLGLPMRRPYALTDMAADAVGLLDGLGLGKAHIVGASMGGMIAQHIAARYHSRVLSLTSIMSSSGNPRLPMPRLDALKALLSRPTNPTDHDSVVAHLVRLFRIIGSPAFPTPEADMRERISRSVRRAYDPPGVAHQLLAIIADGDRRKLLRTITAPTLVIHGAADPLVPPAAARDTAGNIPGARLVLIDGMGHDLPAQLIDRLASEIATHCVAANPS